MELSFRLADPADAELLGRLNFQGHSVSRTTRFHWSGKGVKATGWRHNLSTRSAVSRIYFLLFIIHAFSRVDGILS